MQDYTVGRDKKSRKTAAPSTQECFFMSPLLLLALCFPGAFLNVKMELDFSSVWQLNSWRKLFCSFWAQQRSCLGRQQVPTTLRIFSSQPAIINFKTFSPRNFPRRESREQCILWEDKARLWGWTGHPKSQMQTKNWWKMKDGEASKPP